MAVRVTSWLSWPGMIRMLFAHLRLAVRLLREPSVPLILKAVPLVAALYIVWPIDALPDLLPVLGQVDDLGLTPIALQLFIRWCPADAVAFHRNAISARAPYSRMTPRGQVIDAEWRRE